MAGINFSGLSSGIDSGAIIDQLTQLERAPARALERKKTDLSSQLSVVGDLVSKLQALKTATADLDTASEVRTYAADSNDTDRVTVTSSEATAPGTYNINVTNLATAETTRSAGFVTQDAGVVGVGSVDITTGANPLVNVAYDATDSLADIAGRINETVDGVNASVLFDGSTYRLIVQGTETGQDNAITFADNGSSLGLNDVGAQVVAADNANFTINTMAISRANNNINDVIEGVNFKLESATAIGDPDTVLTVDYDVEGVREKAQAFVDAYNSVSSLLDKQLSFSGEEGDEQAILFGDSTLRGLRQSMSRLVTNGYTHGAGTTSLGMLGIEIGDDGALAIDQTKFDAAIISDPTQIESLFAGDGGDGVSKVFADLVDGYTRAGDGILVAKQDGINSRIKSADSSIERIEERVSALGERLRKQFSALEVFVAKMQSQSGFLQSIIR